MSDTYSFSDIIATIHHPSVPLISTTGQGVGNVTVTWPNENTVHDIAADGNVMVSRIKANNGSVAITMQQTSPLHRKILELFNILNNSSADLWALAVINISSPAGTLDEIIATGVSLAKRPDRPYEAQGQRVTWTFMAANLSHLF